MLKYIYLTIGIGLTVDYLSEVLKAKKDHGPAKVVLNILFFTFCWGLALVWSVFDFLFGKGARRFILSLSFFIAGTVLLTLLAELTRLHFQYPDANVSWFTQNYIWVGVPVASYLWVDSIMDFGKVGNE